MTLGITKSPLLQQIDLQISDFLELKKFQHYYCLIQLHAMIVDQCIGKSSEGYNSGLFQ
jgi:hypothetical protein